MTKRRFLFALLYSATFLAISSQLALGQRKVSEESVIFQEVRDGVVTVFGDEGHGSGFLVHDKGVILTNEHVAGKSLVIRVQLNDSLVVPASLILSDEVKDVAALLVNPDAISSLPVLAVRRNSEDFAMEGERVMAIGSPLNQVRILTTGIVSKMEPTVIISDVNINHGNSGGPLLNMDKEVIGINTFGDFTESGPGVSGILRIDHLLTTIDEAIAIADTLTPPAFKRMPTMPKDVFPLAALEKAAAIKKYNTKAYVTKRGGFNVMVQTPPYRYWQEKQYENRIAEKRRKREEKGGATEKEKYDPNQLREWFQYVGENAPVVAINIVPKIGETKGSIWGNILGAAVAGAAGTYHFGSHRYEFKADLKNFLMTVNGDTAIEIRRGLLWVPMDFYAIGYGGTESGEDLARAGSFIFPYETFGPCNGIWPTVRLEMTRIDKPLVPDTLTLPRKMLEQIWLDFEPYREELEFRKAKRTAANTIEAVRN